MLEMTPEQKSTYLINWCNKRVASVAGIFMSMTLLSELLNGISQPFK
jgi:hypothetical protein